MINFWKVIITVVLLSTIGVNGNRARRHRRQGPMNPNGNPVGNSFYQPPNPQGQPPPQQPPLQPPPMGQNEMGTGKQAGRQYYSPYQGQYGYGSIQNLNYPYAGAGVGSYQYGYGQYGQSGQGLGNYGAYYNQYPGSNSFYGGYNSAGAYNRPGYSNYYPSSGSNNYGGYLWNAGQKQNVNLFTIFLSSLLTFIICLITV